MKPTAFAKASLLILCILTTMYMSLDLMTPENWIPTPNFLRSYGFVFLSATICLLHLGPKNLAQWCVGNPKR